MKRKHRFFFHLNKPKSKLAGRPVWSLHYQNKCYTVNDIRCCVHTETKANKKQPIAVVRGMATSVGVHLEHYDVIATIL